MRLLVLSGLSGAGKSIALQALEDLGFYCVDNLPVGLLPGFVAQMKVMSGKRDVNDIAVGIDARNMIDDLQDFRAILDNIKEQGMDCEVIFIVANDNALIKRFSETRRKHPLTNDNVPLVEAIAAERDLLNPIADCSDLHIDTSQTNVHQLRDQVRDRVGRDASSVLSLQFLSFGFKHGHPIDADFVFDVRCLPNPHWDPALRLQTGRDDDVIKFLEQQAIVKEMLADITTFIERWVPNFEADNRSYLTVAIGCTGGQHRSVYVTETLGAHFKKERERVLIRHREII